MLDISRHKELINPYDFNYPVHVIGAGATGSWVALMLGKLGIRDIHVWDFDIVEEHNIANQVYRNNNSKDISELDIGNSKVLALSNIVKESAGANITIHNEAVTKNTRLQGVVFVMTDTMSSRKEIWEGALKYKVRVPLVIEPRMGLHTGRIYTVNPIDPTQIEKYESNHYADEEAVVSACGISSSVITSAMQIASMCVRQMINWHNEVQGVHGEILLDMMYMNVIKTEW